MMIYHRLLLAFATIVLSACQGLSPVADAAKFALFDPKSPEIYKPGFEYLQLQIDGRHVGMALGRRNSDGRTLDEYWYSSQSEMLNLKNGRIHQALGMTHEVREQLQQAPDWALLLQRRDPYAWYRTLDIQPGYRYGVNEYVVTQKISPSKAQQVKAPKADVWFEESVMGSYDDGRTWSYKQIFALVNQQVVYSEQCLAPHLCISLRFLGVK